MANADRIIDLLYEAKARQAGAEREQFLAEACRGDAALREQIVSLLQAEGAEGKSDFLKITRMIRPESAPAEKPGDRIGRYKLLEQIGEGGCGVVYMAEQQEPVRRRIALKVIKLGMDTKQVVARFEAERQALAMMDHPNIAKVLDGGATDTGRPFFVMELVRGIKITDYCDENHLSTEARLDLFIKICGAVQHAHQKGIIHRDLKPSNILVADHDGVPVPKIIDFGIAKVTTGQSLTDKTLFTAFEQFMGTPAYMSPEQARLSGLDIDTRTDIYSLGVLLYELLTGQTPFDAKALLKAGLDEMRHIIREQEAPRPSNRLSTMQGEDLTTTARHRNTEPPKLIHLLRGDLDWIVMKCLEKDRARRYETANGLAMDIQRHLTNEPVVARSPSRLYRFGKLARRNKLAFGAAAVVVIALVSGLFVSTWSLAKEKKARHRAIVAEAEQSRLREAEIQQRQRAETQEHFVREQLYATKINVAHRAWEDGDMDGMQEALDSLQPAAGAEDLRGFEWHYLKSLQMGSQRVIHQGAHERAIALSPNGEMMAVGGSDVPPRPIDWAHHSTLATTNRMSIHLYRLSDGKLLRKIPAHDGYVNALAFTPDGKRLVSAGYDQLVKVWHVEEGSLEFELSGHTNQVACVAVSPDGATIASGAGRPGAGFGRNQSSRFDEASGTQDEIILWDAHTGRLRLRFPAQTNGVLSVAFSPDGSRLAGGGFERTVKIWNASTGRLDKSFNILDGARSVAFSPDGNYLVVSVADAWIMAWDLKSDRSRSIKTGPDQIFASVLSPDGKTLAVSEYDHTIRLFSFPDFIPRTMLRGHRDNVWSLAFSSDSKTLASASWDGTARLWDTQKTEGLQLSQNDAGIVALGFCKQRPLVATTDYLWDSASFEPLSALPKSDFGQLFCLQFSPDGKYIARAGEGGVMPVWDLEHNLPKCTVAQTNKVWSLAYSHDGQTLVTAAASGEINCWDANTGAHVYRFPMTMDFARSLAFSPDGQTLAVVGRAAGERVLNLELWNWNDRSLKSRTSVSASGSVAYSPDGKSLALIGPNNAVQIWDADPPKRRHEMRGHTDAIWNLTFASNGRTLASSSWDGTVRLWHVPTGTELLALRSGNGNQVFSLAFSPDGSQLVAGLAGSRLARWTTNSLSDSKIVSR